MSHDYDIRYRSTEESVSEITTEVDAIVLEAMEDSPISSITVAHYTKKDAVFIEVLSCVRDGWDGNKGQSANWNHSSPLNWHLRDARGTTASTSEMASESDRLSTQIAHWHGQNDGNGQTLRLVDEHIDFHRSVL